jgi:hypothetical protein
MATKYSQRLVKYHNSRALSCKFILNVSPLQSSRDLKASLPRRLSVQMFQTDPLNFIQTSEEWSVPRLVVHTVGMYGSMNIVSYGPSIIFIFTVCTEYSCNTTNAI